MSMLPTHFALGVCPNGRSHSTEYRWRHHDPEAHVSRKSTDQVAHWLGGLHIPLLESSSSSPFGHFKNVVVCPRYHGVKESVPTFFLTVDFEAISRQGIYFFSGDGRSEIVIL